MKYSDFDPKGANPAPVTPTGHSNTSLSHNPFPFLPIVLSSPDAAQMTLPQPWAQALNNEQQRAHGHQQKAQN